MIQYIIHRIVNMIHGEPTAVFVAGSSTITPWSVLAVICAVYFLILLIGNHGTWFFFIWLFMAAFFGTVHITIKNGSFFRIPELIRYVGTEVILAGIIILVVSCCFSISGFFMKNDAENLDTIVVLGAQVYENAPSRVLKHRLDKAVSYLEENENTTVIVSGGQGSNEPRTESSVMKEYLMEQGISEDRIIEENTSRNTVENLENCEQYLDKENDRIGIVTSNYHAFRGTHIAMKLGYKNVYGIPSYTTALYLPHNLLRESLSIVKDKLLGNI